MDRRPAMSLLDRRAAGSAAVLLAGALAYAVVEGVAKARFDITPLALGVIAVVAGLAGDRPRLVATGLVLAGWGGAVLLVDHGVVPGPRATPAYMLGVGVGLLVASRLAPAAERGAWLTSGAIVAVAGPLSLYLTYDVAAMGRWPLWAVVLVAWAGWELFWSTRRAPAEAPAA